jgi:hypothetical protein
MARVDSSVSIVTPNRQPDAQPSAGERGAWQSWSYYPEILFLLTVLDQNIETLLDEQVRVEHDEAE